MQDDLKNLETLVLIDMLAQKTALYTSKLVEKTSVELQQYEYDITLIQSELNSREQTKGNENLADRGTALTPETIPTDN